MKNLKVIMLAVVLAAGISILPVAGSSTTYVYHDIHAMSAEELALAEANCPFSEENQGSSQVSTPANPLPAYSAIVASNGATGEPRGADLPLQGTISTYIKGSINDPHRADYLNDRSFEYKQAQALFDSTKTDIFNSKIESLSDSPPVWRWDHSIGDTSFQFDGSKWVEDPGHCWNDPRNCTVLNLFPGFKLNSIF